MTVRTPFVDDVVLERLLALAPEARPHGKGIRKRLLARHVPREIWDRPKRGFVLPLDRWIAGPLRDRVRKTVCEDGPAGLRVDAKRAVWARFERAPARMATRVWALVVLDEWCRRHL